MGEWKRRGRDCLCAEEIVEAIVCFLFGFCFRRLVEVVIVGGKTSEAGVPFFEKK